MHDIDLVPGEFRAWTLFTQRVKLFGLSAVVIILAIVAGFVVLNQLTEQAQMRVDALQNQKDISTRQRTELQALIANKENLQNQLTLLTGLRGGSTALEMFQTIDEALSGDEVWFTSWQYRRAGTVVKADDNKQNTGYFIVLPKGEKTTETEAWHIKTHMNITGEALDHSALSDFVMRLISQPLISDVRVLSTTTKQKSDVRLIGFNLAVTVFGKADQS